jgi:hypothetical protein
MTQTQNPSATPATDDKGKMTLFKDDRAEDIGAIILTILVVAFIVFWTR